LIASFLIALREGVEAALIVGIVLVYLERTGRSRLVRFVWAGVGLAAGLSFAVAVALDHWKIDQDGFEGLLLLLAAFFVVSMIVWMNRVARFLRKHIEQKVESLADKSEFASGFGIGAFVFLMVLREGAELALILRAVELSSEGLGVWLGTGLGLATAIAVGVFFFQGTLGIPLARFFKATTAILVVVAVQLGLTGVHELSEARWLPSGKTEMAMVGPIVRNDFFFFVLILGAAALVVLREWMAMSREAVVDPAAGEAERRREAWTRRNHSRWMFAAAIGFVVVMLTLAAEFVYARVASADPESQIVTAQGNVVLLPIADVSDGNMHLFRIDLNGTEMRFMVIHKPDGHWGTALDACSICGWAGYRQSGSNIVCRNCASAIYIPTIGQAGGCNPVGVASRVEGQYLVMDLSAIAAAAGGVPR
jgi:high-affinity iron transporter